MKLDFENQADDVRIELIPLIDVIFCILIFFILASLQLTRQQAISINLPQSSTSALQTRKTLIVSIDRNEQIYVDQQPVTQDNLFYLMQGFNQENPDGLMVLYADRSATYDSVVQLLDFMRQVGGRRVALATQQPQPGGGDPSLPGLNPDLSPALDGQDPLAPGLDGLPQVPGGVVDPFGVPEDSAAPAPPPPGVTAPGTDSNFDPGQLVPPPADSEFNAPGDNSNFDPSQLAPPPSDDQV